MAQRPLEGPQAVVFGERVLTLLVRAGLSDEDAVGAMLTLVNYTTGASVYRLSRRGAATQNRLTDLDAADAPLARRMRRRIAAAAESDRQFTDGLKRILAGYLPASPR